MSRLALPRRSALLMPFLLAACGGGGDEDTVFVPLRYNYLPPIELNVASISIEQRFVAAGVPPDVSASDPEPPAEALRAMANDRLMAFGTANKATFIILDASLARTNDTITGSMAVRLSILDNNGSQLGFAEAQVRSQHTGSADPLRTTLYDMTKSLMSEMNIEFEYRVRQNLKPWLTSATAPDTPVEQAPLGQPGGPQPANPQPGAPQPDSMTPSNPSSPAPQAQPTSPDLSAPPAAAAPNLGAPAGSNLPPPMPLGSGAD